MVSPYSPTPLDDAILGAIMRPDRTLGDIAIELKLTPSFLLRWAARPEIRELMASLTDLLTVTEGIRRAARQVNSFTALERVMKESPNLVEVRRAATTTLNATRTRSASPRAAETKPTRSAPASSRAEPPPVAPPAGAEPIASVPSPSSAGPIIGRGRSPATALAALAGSSHARAP